MRSAVEASAGDPQAALHTQETFIRGPGLAHLAVGLSFALAPVALAARVAGSGFAEGGIIAGTAAADLMASYGGSVGAGSLCAVLQV